MFSVITNIYNKKPEVPILMELFTATKKLKKSFLFVTTNNMRHIYKFVSNVFVWKMTVFARVPTLLSHDLSVL